MIIIWAIIDCAMEKFKTFDVVDMGILKVCLISFGILVGVLGEAKLRKSVPAIIMIFIASYVYIMYKFINAPSDEYYEIYDCDDDIV